MTKTTVRRIIRLANGGPINAYDAEGEKDKEAFLAAVAKELARLMGLAEGTYEIRTNRAGIAVSGDVTLHGERIYVCLEQFCIPNGFYYRRVDGRTDYCGKFNRWAKWERLLDLPLLAEDMKRVSEDPRG
jgi:hypothetical protein